MNKYQIPKDHLRLLLQDRIDWSKSNTDFIQTIPEALKYVRDKLGVFVDFSDIPEKYIDYAFNQILPVLPNIGITCDEQSYYLTIESYDSFIYEVKYRAIFKQIMDRKDIQFVINDKDKISVIKRELKVP